MASKPKLYSLSDVARKTGISLPTLQRYKKLYQSRIPSVGAGRKQRYPKEALAEFRKIKRENLKKRGRPRKQAAAGKGAAGRKKTARKTKSRKAKTRKKAAARKKPTTRKKTSARKKATTRKKAKTRKKAAGRRKTAKRRAKKATAARGAQGSLLSLSEIGRRTGISYPTLMRYVKLQLDKIPHVLEGSRRLFPEEAVEVFRTIRASTRRGRRKGSVSKAVSSAVPVSGALSKKIRELEKAQKQISKQLRDVLDHLRKPLEVTVKRK